jgi:hypothetical protein
MRISQLSPTALLFHAYMHTFSLLRWTICITLTSLSRKKAWFSSLIDLILFYVATDFAAFVLWPKSTRIELTQTSACKEAKLKD